MPSTPVIIATNGYGIPVFEVASGGLPVSVAESGLGTPIVLASNGMGVPVTFDAAAATLAGTSANVLAIAYQDTSLIVRDSTTPANTFFGTAFSKLSFARSGNAYYMPYGGAYATAGTNVPRIGYSSSRTFLGLHIEGARTNLSTRSDDLSVSPWSADRSGGVSPVVTADYGAAPDDTITADRVVLNKTGGVFSRLRNGLAAQPSVAHTTSAFYKNLLVGTANVGLRNSTSGINCAATSLWQRFSVTFTSTSPDTQIILFDTIVGNDETADILATWAQVEAADFASTYIPTTSAAITRNAETCTLATSAFPWSNSTGVISLAARTALGVSGNQVFLQVDDGSENNRHRIVRDSGGDIRYIVTTAGVEVANLNGGAIANDTVFSVSAGFDGTGFSLSVNGGAAVTSGVAALPTVTTLRQGHSFTGEYCFGTLQTLKITPTV